MRIKILSKQQYYFLHFLQYSSTSVTKGQGAQKICKNNITNNQEEVSWGIRPKRVTKYFRMLKSSFSLWSGAWRQSGVISQVNSQFVSRKSWGKEFSLVAPFEGYGEWNHLQIIAIIVSPHHLQTIATILSIHHLSFGFFSKWLLSFNFKSAGSRLDWS